MALGLIEMNTRLQKNMKETFIEVDDNWYGNYDGNKVKFILSSSCDTKLDNNRYIFYISFDVMGNDDFFLTKVYVFEGTYKEYYAYYLTFLKEYNKILNDKSVKNKKYFYNLGYIRY